MVLSCTISEIWPLIGWKLRIFRTHSHLTPSLGVSPVGFLDELFVAKTIESLGYPSVKISWSYSCLILTQCQRVTDRRTDGRADGRTDRQTTRPGSQGSACIASYAGALKNVYSIYIYGQFHPIVKETAISPLLEKPSPDDDQLSNCNLSIGLILNKKYFRLWPI